MSSGIANEAGPGAPKQASDAPSEARREPARPLSAAEAPFDAIGLARRLLRTIRSGALASLDPEGIPFASLVTIATDVDGTPLMLLSQLSAHTRNLVAEPRASLLFSAGGRGDPLAHPRLTVTGRASRTTDERARARFLARHPKAKLYADFPDFGFFRLDPIAGHLNGGFAKAATLTPSELCLDLSGAQALVAGERGAVEHMNADHADALALYANGGGRAGGQGDGQGSGRGSGAEGDQAGGWRLTGLDPEGMDLMAGERTARVLYPSPVGDMGALRQALIAMAKEAREAGT